MDRPSRSPSGTTKVKVSTTCTNCRERHLKCDGGPVCSRCRTDGSSCVFVTSRRGYRINSRRKVPPSPPHLLGVTPRPQKTSSRHSSWDPTQFPIRPHIDGSASYATQISQPQSSPNSLGSVPAPISKTAPIPSIECQDYAVPNLANNPQSIHLFNLFYTYFYPAHPFLLPREYLSERLSKGNLRPLQSAIDYIGSCYDSSLHRCHFQNTAECELLNQEISRDVYYVQALLLFSIGLVSCDELEKAELSLKLAINLAIELGMNRRDFSWLDGQGCQVNEESWRRTWWELYVVDGYFAGAHPSKTFRLSTVPADTLLPCEDREYFSGQIPNPRSVGEFNDRGFSDESFEFSSYSYRIGAVRIYAKTLPLELKSPAGKHFLDDADTSLVSFWLYLPDSKKCLIGLDGQFDEVLFQAHMLLYCAIILLHRAQSSLAYTSLPSDVRKDTSTAHSNILQPGNLDFHTGKTLCAADMIVKLITIPRPMISHSPFIQCGLALSCIVHLTAWPLFIDDGSGGAVHLANMAEKAGLSFYEVPEQFYATSEANSGNINSSFQQANYASTPSSQSSYAAGYQSDGQQRVKDKIQLQIGALLNIGKIWPGALKHMENVKFVSRQVFAWSKAKQIEVSFASQAVPASSGVAPDLSFNNGQVDLVWNKPDGWEGNTSYDISQLSDLDVSLLQDFHMDG